VLDGLEKPARQMFLQIVQPCRVWQDLGNSSNSIVTSLNGLPGRWHAQISIDDLRKTELPELLGDCVRDFRFGTKGTKRTVA
jgi:hypothetical protein